MSDHDDVLDYLIAPTTKTKNKNKQDWAQINAEILLLNNSFSTIMHGSTVGVLHEQRSPAGAIDIKILEVRAFLNWFAEHNFTHPEDADKKINIGKMWWESRRKRKYIRLVFDPGAHTEDDEYNLWTGFTFEPTDHGDCSLFLDHIRANICNGNAEHFHWVMCWMADLIQRPGRKPGVAIVLRGGEGIGKGFFAEMLGALISRHYMAITSEPHITGKFNSHLANKILVFVDEAACSGEKKTQAVLYGLVTEPSAVIEFKGKDAASIKSYLRLILASNNAWVVPANMDARRWAVFDVGSHAKNNKQYFIDISDQMRNGGYQKLMEILMHWEIDINIANNSPKTSALLDQKIASFSSDKAWWFEVLCSGDIGFGAWPLRASKKDLYKGYLSWCSARQVRNVISYEVCMKTIKFLCGRPEEQRIPRKNINDFIFQDLDICRAAFDEAMGQPYKWEE